MASGFSHRRKKIWVEKKHDEYCLVLGRERMSFSL